MGVFSQSVTAGFSVLLRLNGVDGRYRRGDEEWPVRLLIASGDNPQAIQHAQNRAWNERRWQGLLAHLVEAGFDQPQPDDLFIVETASGEETWSVISDRDQCWQPVAGSAEVFEVRTMLIQ